MAHYSNPLDILLQFEFLFNNIWWEKIIAFGLVYQWPELQKILKIAHIACIWVGQNTSSWASMFKKISYLTD